MTSPKLDNEVVPQPAVEGRRAGGQLFDPRHTSSSTRSPTRERKALVRPTRRKEESL